jgi:hypothetical protein
MAKLNCPCGYQMSNVMSPCPYNGYLITDRQLETFHDEPDGLSIAIIDKGRDIWECPECGRMAIVKDDNHYKWYSPDDGNPANFCATKGPPPNSD